MKKCGFDGPSRSLLGLKSFLIWDFILLVMVNFIFRGKFVSSAIPTNQGYFGNLLESRIF